MTNYTKGRAFEYQIKKLLEKNGVTVFRTAGSHSPVDLIAFQFTPAISLDTMFIQCKTGKKINKEQLIRSVERKFMEIEVPLNYFECYLFIKEDRKEPEFYWINPLPYEFLVNKWRKVSEVWK